MTQKIDVDYEFLVLEGQPSFQDQLPCSSLTPSTPSGTQLHLFVFKKTCKAPW